MSQQERVSWLSLVTTLVLGTWYFQHIFAMPADTDLHGPAMGRLVTRLVVIAILAGIAGEMLLSWAQRQVDGGDDATAEDERDVMIKLKSLRNAHFVLGAGVVAVLVQIGRVEWVPGRRSGAQADTVLDQLLTGPLSALHVAQWLLLALMLASLTLYGSRVAYYRHD